MSTPAAERCPVEDERGLGRCLLDDGHQPDYQHAWDGVEGPPGPPARWQVARSAEPDVVFTHLTEDAQEALRDWWDDEAEGATSGSMLGNLDAAVERILAARMATAQADGWDKCHGLLCSPLTFGPCPTHVNPYRTGDRDE